MSQYVSATFFDDARANDAVDDLIDLGYSRDAIDVIMSRETRPALHAGNRTRRVAGRERRQRGGEQAA